MYQENSQTDNAQPSQNQFVAPQQPQPQTPSGGNQQKDHQKIRKIAGWLRYAFLAIVIFSIVRTVVFFNDPTIGLGGIAIFFILPILLLVLFITLMPWEKRAKNPYIPLIAYGFIIFQVAVSQLMLLPTSNSL